MEKTCCFPGCTQKIGAQHLACRDHWLSLSKEDRNQIQYRRCGWGSRNEGINYLLEILKSNDAKRKAHEHERNRDTDRETERNAQAY
jgi:hypothetical protein